MGVCEGCAINFRKLGSATCVKCNKLQKTTSDIERLAIENQPQCMSCSVIFPFMKNSTCGGCAAQPELAPPGVAADYPQRHILDRSIEYQKSASQHRLNQPSAKQNANLQAATAKKEALSALKKQSRAETISVVSTLNAYPLKGALKKHITLPTQKRWPGETHAKTVLLKAKEDLKAAYFESPAAERDGAMVLNFEQITYGILKSTKSVFSFKPTEENLIGTIDQLFRHLNEEGKLSDSDFKSRSISLELYVYEVEMEPDSDSPIKPTRQYMSSYTSRAKSTKRKASGSISSNDPYVSGYRPQKSAARPIRQNSIPELEYEDFTFSKTTFSTDAEGNVKEHIHKDRYSIRIASGWQKDIGDAPKNGYVAKGLTKYVFKGLFNGKAFAIFQCKPIRVTNSQNLIDLTAELRLLSYGQYFANSFAKRAAAYHVTIPAIRWNSQDAFLGSVDSADIGTPPAEGEEDNRALIFSDFLATPLLSTAGLYTERKFSGSNEAGDSVDDIGRAIDAFAHHVLVDSHGSFLLTDLQGLVGPDKEVILFDPQAHSLERNTGFWDRGREAIIEWLDAHKCKSVCKKLGLANAVLSELHPGPKPLRTGWPSPGPSNS